MPQRQAEWDRWYLAHLQVMLTVKGIRRSASCSSRATIASLALYTIVSPDVFQDAYYLRIRGMGEWLPLIDRRHYRRNLFAGSRRHRMWPKHMYC